MKTYSLSLFLSICFLFFACNPQQKEQSQSSTQDAPKHEFAIALHGGAGVIKKENMSDSLEQAYKEKLKEAITAGHQILEDGGSAIEAVKATINVMENSPLFNSGKGAVLNHEEKPELDASIMDGKTLNAGAIAGVSHIKNPIDLAISVMNDSPHVLLAGAGAEQFAMEQGFDTVPSSYFVTKRRLDQVRRMKANAKGKTASVFYDPYIQDDKYGTVGCVALDKDGNLAAGTSTGGTANKLYGRIGDSPIIGAGTYANNHTVAVSSTGTGEYFIRGVVAYDISALMEYKGMSLAEATHKVIQEKQVELGGDGGVVAMDKNGNVSHEFNTPGMFRAKMDDQGNIEIGIYKEDQQ